jgi:hypothetical protein
MLFESFCTTLGGKIDNLFGFFIAVAYILMIVVGLPAVLIKVFILN